MQKKPLKTSYKIKTTRLQRLILILSVLIFVLWWIKNDPSTQSFGIPERSAETSTMLNMYTLQIMLETYGVDWDGHYPNTVSALRQSAQNYPNPYWKELTNPYTQSKEEGNAYANIDSPPIEGMVLYQPIGAPVHGYRITAYGHSKKELLKQKNSVFSLEHP